MLRPHVSERREEKERERSVKDNCLIEQYLITLNSLSFHSPLTSMSHSSSSIGYSNDPSISDSEHGIRASGRLPLLRKNNYDHWKFRMEYILDNKGLLEVVLGSEMRPDTSANDQQIWDKKDKEARQLIVMCVNEDQDNYLYGAKTASEMWAKLSSVYQEKSTANSLQLKSRFYSLKKATEDSMIQHINKMVELMEELRALGIKIPEEDSIMVLLNSLSDTYRMVKVALRTHEGLTYL